MSHPPTYLWIVEWDDQLVSPQRVEVRHLTRLAGVSDEEFEKHLVDVEIPAQAAVSTRVGQVTRQLLLRLSGPRESAVAYAGAPEGVAAPVGEVAVSIGRNAEVVWSSDQPAATPVDEREV